MKNLKPLYILLTIGVLIAPSVAKDKIVESKWTAAPVRIDGSSAEWAQDALETEKSVEASYAFKNDANFLYVLFIFNNPIYLSTVEDTGMTFWVNTEGKEKKIRGLRFHRKAVSADQLIQSLESEGQTLTDQKKQELRSKTQYLLFAYDVVNKKGEIVPQSGMATGTYRLARVEKSTIYEFVVPLELLADPSSDKKWDPAKPFKLGFEWGGLTDEMKKARAPQLSGEERSESNENRFRVPDSATRQSPKRYDFWISLQIAQNK
jgi:hypothetical protein